VMMWETEPIIRNAASLRSGCASWLLLSGQSEVGQYEDRVVLMNCKIPLNEDFWRLLANVNKSRLAAVSGVKYSSYTSIFL